MHSEAPPQERYLHKPFAGSSHCWALGLCEHISPTARVLDVGPGSGVIGRTLRERGVSQLYAVEVDERARSFVAPYYQRVEPALDAFRGEKFDRVILLDVLEHMTDPSSFLTALTSYLAPGAELLVSVPNVAHWSIRLLLFFGYFPYMSRGILDATHLQFFTRSRLRNMLSTANLTVVSEAVSIPPAEFVLPKVIWDNGVYRALNQCHYRLAQLLPGLLGYQLLAHVRAP